MIGDDNRRGGFGPVAPGDGNSRAIDGEDVASGPLIKTRGSGEGPPVFFGPHIRGGLVNITPRKLVRVGHGDLFTIASGADF